MSCAERISTKVLDNANILGSSQALSACTAVEVRGSGCVSIHYTVDNGAGAAPTDSPVGSWEVYTSADGVNYALAGGTGEDGTGNVVSQKRTLLVPPGSYTGGGLGVTAGHFVKTRYLRNSGGGGDSRATATITTW